MGREMGKKGVPRGMADWWKRDWRDGVGERYYKYYQTFTILTLIMNDVQALCLTLHLPCFSGRHERRTLVARAQVCHQNHARKQRSPSLHWRFARGRHLPGRHHSHRTGRHQSGWPRHQDARLDVHPDRTPFCRWFREEDFGVWSCPPNRWMLSSVLVMTDESILHVERGRTLDRERLV